MGVMYRSQQRQIEKGVANTLLGLDTAQTMVPGPHFNYQNNVKRSAKLKTNLLFLLPTPLSDSTV